LSIYSGKINQNEVNYAKQTQFLKKSNVYNLIKNNELQRKMQNGHLVKTNPNKANFTQWIHYIPTFRKYFYISQIRAFSGNFLD
jgi:hypothetical protein